MSSRTKNKSKHPAKADESAPAVAQREADRASQDSMRARGAKPKNSRPKSPAAHAKVSLRAWGGETRVSALRRVFVRTRVDLNRYGKKATFEFFGSDTDVAVAHNNAALLYWRESLGQEVIVLQMGTVGPPYTYLAIEIVLCKTVRVTDAGGGNTYISASSFDIKESYVDGALLAPGQITVVTANDAATGKLIGDKYFTLSRFDLAANATTALIHEVVLQAELKVTIGGTEYAYLVDPGIIIAPRRP